MHIKDPVTNVGSKFEEEYSNKIYINDNIIIFWNFTLKCYTNFSSKIH